MAGNIAMENGPFVGDSKKPSENGDLLYYFIYYHITIDYIITI